MDAGLGDRIGREVLEFVHPDDRAAVKEALMEGAVGGAATQGSNVPTMSARLRNYQDLAPLASTYAEKGLAFPGVLFIATSVPQADAGHHIRSLLAWIEAADQAGHNPGASTYGWLR